MQNTFQGGEIAKACDECLLDILAFNLLFVEIQGGKHDSIGFAKASPSQAFAYLCGWPVLSLASDIKTRMHLLLTKKLPHVDCAGELDRRQKMQNVPTVLRQGRGIRYEPLNKLFPRFLVNKYHQLCIIALGLERQEHD